MSIKLRFAFLLGLLLAGLLLALGLQRRFEARAEAELHAAERAARIQLFNHGVEMSSRALPQVAAEIAHAEELPQLLSQSADEIRRHFSRALVGAGLDLLWLVRADGSVVLAVAPEGAPAPPSAPLPPADLAALLRETPAPRFFAEAGSAVAEVCIRRIQTAGPGGAGWLAVGRRWDAAHLRGIEALADGRISLLAPHAPPRMAEQPRAFTLQRPLPDWQGRPLRILHLEMEESEVAQTLRADEHRVGLFFAFGAGLILATALALQLWVVRPLGRIGASLATGDPAPLTPLQDDRSELGQVARLARDSFAQKRALQAEVEQRKQAQKALEESEHALRENLEERARLGRDLHDGVIQALYAAGMGLAGIRVLLRADQADAVSRLEQTRAALNETIHDVRNFIVGLEPEALRVQTFSQAIAALLDAMRAHRDFAATVEIDDDVARRLTLAQRVHALQIAREATSNALRHGAATRLTVALHRTGESVEFAVADDGAGFDPAAGLPPGRGLANFRQRAGELGASLHVESEPGNGTRVRLVFSLLIL